VDGKMVGTFHDPALVVTAAPNEADAEEEDDEPTVMVTKVGAKTVTTIVTKPRDEDEEDSGGGWRRTKKKGPRHYSFDPVPGLLRPGQHGHATTLARSPVTELHHAMPQGHLIVSMDRCTGLKRKKEHRSEGVFCVVAVGNTGLARRTGTVYESGKTLLWKGHHGTIVFSGLEAAPPLLHIFVLRRAPSASTAVADASAATAARKKSAREVRAALIEIYTAHKPSKLGSVEGLLEEWKGHETELLANVRAKYAAQDSAEFDGWGRTGGCALLGAVTLQFDQAPSGRSWRLAQEVQLLRPDVGDGGGSGSRPNSPDAEGASLESESEGEGGVSVSRMLLGARGGPGGWGSECAHAGKLRTSVRWAEPARKGAQQHSSIAEPPTIG
jgi:hypothetical protein